MKTQVKALLTLSALTMVALLNGCGRAQVPMTPQFQSAPRQVSALNNQSQEILLQFTPRTDRRMAQVTFEKYGLRTVNFLPNLNTYVVTVDHAVSADTMRLMLASLSRESNVRNVEVNGRVGMY